MGKKLDAYSLHNISSDDEYIYAMTNNEFLASKDSGLHWKSLPSVKSPAQISPPPLF